MQIGGSTEATGDSQSGLALWSEWMNKLYWKWAAATRRRGHSDPLCWESRAIKCSRLYSSVRSGYSLICISCCQNFAQVLPFWFTQLHFSLPLCLSFCVCLFLSLSLSVSACLSVCLFLSFCTSPSLSLCVSLSVLLYSQSLSLSPLAPFLDPHKVRYAM